MNSFSTFLSNNYIWFLAAAAIFLFALIGLIIESAKKHKKNKSDTIESAAPVEAFRHEHTSGAETVAPTVEETKVEESVPATEQPVEPIVPVESVAPVEVAPTVETPVAPIQEPQVVEPVIENVEGPKQPEPIEDKTFSSEPAPVMDASPVFANVESAVAPTENVLPEPQVVEPINPGSAN